MKSDDNDSDVGVMDSVEQVAVSTPGFFWPKGNYTLAITAENAEKDIAWNA